MLIFAVAAFSAPSGGFLKLLLGEWNLENATDHTAVNAVEFHRAGSRLNGSLWRAFTGHASTVLDDGPVRMFVVSFPSTTQAVVTDASTHSRIADGEFVGNETTIVRGTFSDGKAFTLTFFDEDNGLLTIPSLMDLAFSRRQSPSPPVPYMPNLLTCLLVLGIGFLAVDLWARITSSRQRTAIVRQKKVKKE
jgi:hypothetical protein